MKTKYIIENGKGMIKEYDENDKLIFQGEYLNGEKMEKEKNMILNITNYYLKENI